VADTPRSGTSTDPRRDFAPFPIGRRLLLRPPGPADPDETRIEIVLVRGAFGSGEHETTASCLEALEELEALAGASVLDFGSGTGVLAIAALKLGARLALCVDNDPRAVATARENCRLNALSDRIEHRLGTLEVVGSGLFDVVLANIYADILRAEAENLVARTRPGGVLLLSGIPLEDSYDLRLRYERQGCTVRWSRVLEDYGTVLLQRDESASGVTNPVSGD